MTAGELYEKLLADSREVNRVLKDAENGKITFREAYAHAQRLGELAAQAIRESGSLAVDATMEQTLAVLSPVLRRDYALAQEGAEAAVQAANDAAGIGMKPSRARLRADRISGIASEIAEQGWEAVEPVIDAQIVTFSQSAVDDTVRANMNAQAGAGFSPKIVRTADAKACAWCLQLVGTYDYDRVRATGSDVYRRHRDCRCVVEFVPDRSGRRQNVWDKSWRDTTAMRDVQGLDNDREAGRIEARREIGTDFYTGPNGKTIEARHENWIGDNRMLEHLEQAQSEAAKSYIRADFRKSSFIGDGSTAAIRQFELETGLNCGRNGNSHAQKVHDLIRKIEKTPLEELPESDRKMLTDMLNRLKETEE